MDHGRATWPGIGIGVAFTEAYIMSKGDHIADITEDITAGEKARANHWDPGLYVRNIMNLNDS